MANREREQNLSSPGLATHLESTSNTSELWDSTGEESVPSQLLIISEKGAVAQRK